MDISPNPPQPETGSNKKWLLIVGLVVLIAVIGAAWFYVIVMLKPPSNNSGNNSDTSSTGSDTPGINSPCSITASTVEGPYYVTDAPALIAGNLNYTNLPGEPIKITGHVYGGEGTTKPLANAKVDIWQADSDGIYHPQGNGPATRYGVGQIALRGYVLTDPTGYYEFTSIYPGEYEDRARHIHARAMVDGYSGVITQLIMPKDGDKTTAAKDSIAKSLPGCNTLVFENGAATFDFHLQ